LHCRNHMFFFHGLSLVLHKVPLIGLICLTSIAI
jgi:hypothetical protein